MQIEIPDSATINVPNGGGTMTVDLSAMPANVLRNFFAYGVQQKLSDACADKTKFPDARARINDVIAQLQSGTWASRNVGPRGDSVLIEALELYINTHPRADRKKADRIKDGRTILTGPDSDAKAKLLAAMADEIAKVRAKYETAVSNVPSVV